MKIDDVMRKCLEIPGTSIKRGEYSAELILKTKVGKGSMTFFPLFPGLTLAYIFVNSPTWTAPDFHTDSSVEKGPLLLNYCVTGRCEMILNSESFVYVKDGEVSLTERFAQKQYVYPRRIYEGMEFFIDLDTVASQSAWLQQEFGIDFRQIANLYCPDGSTYIAAAANETEDLFQKLWSLFDLPVPYAIMQMKIYTAALFSVLQNLQDIPRSQACTFFTETQVEIAKRTAKILSDDLRQHIPIRRIAERFSVSETSLKNYFRGVYGQNVSAWLKKIRMDEAARLLTYTKRPIAELAEQVGYSNQGKFAAAFKRQFGLSPLEYRRSKNLENSSNEKPWLLSQS